MSPAKELTVGERIRLFFEEVTKAKRGWQGEAAARLTALVGGPYVLPNQFSKWVHTEEIERIDRYALAAIALLHPTDPRACLEWFQGRRAEMPPLPRTRPQDDESDVERAVATIRAVRRAQGAIRHADRQHGEPPAQRRRKDG